MKSFKPQPFTYRELDVEGLATLEAISGADGFNRWMYEQVSPWLKGRVIEFGSGIGNLSKFFLEEGKAISLSDIRPPYCAYLRNKYGDRAEVYEMNLTDHEFESRFAALAGSFDSAFALNVIEHIEDDVLALKNAAHLLKTGGRLLVLVPAHPILYNRVDRELEHYRRYTGKGLNRKMEEAGLKVESSFSFNALGIAAWVYGGLIREKGGISSRQMNRYEQLVPLARGIDRLIFRRIGLSVVSVGSKL